MYHLHVPLFRLHVHVFHDITLYLQDFKDQVVRHIFKWDLDLLPAAVLNFIDKCMEIIWLMCIQEPPMVITWANDGESVNTNYYTFYSRKGEIVKQPVWPAVFLQHGGPLLTRGVVVPVQIKYREYVDLHVQFNYCTVFMHFRMFVADYFDHVSINSIVSFG